MFFELWLKNRLRKVFGERFSRALYTASPALRPEMLSKSWTQSSTDTKVFINICRKRLRPRVICLQNGIFFFFSFIRTTISALEAITNFLKFRLNTIQNITESSFRNINLTWNNYLTKHFNTFRFYRKKIIVLIMIKK